MLCRVCVCCCFFECGIVCLFVCLLCVFVCLAVCLIVTLGQLRTSHESVNNQGYTQNGTLPDDVIAQATGNCKACNPLRPHTPNCGHRIHVGVWKCWQRSSTCPGMAQEKGMDGGGRKEEAGGHPKNSCHPKRHHRLDNTSWPDTVRSNARKYDNDGKVGLPALHESQFLMNNPRWTQYCSGKCPTGLALWIMSKAARGTQRSTTTPKARIEWTTLQGQSGHGQPKHYVCRAAL